MLCMHGLDGSIASYANLLVEALDSDTEILEILEINSPARASSSSKTNTSRSNIPGILMIDPDVYASDIDSAARTPDEYVPEV
eukprot:845783-Amorphochlora_amoeboformis.AAC.1